MSEKKRKKRTAAKKIPSEQARKPGVSPISGVAPPKEYQFKPGQSGNPGGRPKTLGLAYAKVLESVFPPELISRQRNERTPNVPSFGELVDLYAGEKDAVITYADKIALQNGIAAAGGDLQAAKEMRAGTEGEKIVLPTWQTEIIDALKAGKITAEVVIAALGEQAKPVLFAAGIFTNVTASSSSGTTATSTESAGETIVPDKPSTD